MSEGIAGPPASAGSPGGGASGEDSDAADRALLRRIASGDEAALSALMDRHASRIHTVCFHMLPRAEEAEEIGHDVFVAVWKGAAAFQGRSRVSTWLYRIAVRACLDRRRRVGRFRRAMERLAELAGIELPGIAGLVSSFPAPDRRLDAAEAEQRLDEALASIPEPYRAALLLYEREDLSYEEVGQALSIPVGTVRSRVRRARLALVQAQRQR